MNLTPEQLDEYYIIQFPLGYLKFDSEVTPSQYLEYAKKDLQDGSDPRNLVNSLGNAKRALHLQVETIANGFGYKKLKRSSNFPAKLEFLSELGVATPSIISKINALRNKVEHEYIVPEVEQVEDYCDIVELFLRATESAINMFPDLTEFESNDSSDGIPSELPEMLIIKVVEFEGEIDIDGEIITVENADYSIWIKQILKHVFRRV